ncbi:MAG: SusC/RagA family TonB-linked outer membrane protein [Gemmatimonadaceae bacterium]|nr:SusC/RagA family TonB-linked outer membrane protein [Gemmatimonadaceae bacterium]NUS96566.1 SusC/RagA family TonB-linked outer membrane protein [Gemmatimonadaceae bacterium]
MTATGSGEALANTAVSVVGTTIGTYTADDGSFQLLAPSGDVSLLARRVGFKRTTIAVPAGQEQVSISLERDVLQLEEQVVTGTATTVSSVNAANAVAVVSGEQLNRVPAQTIDNALQGKVAGATITQNNGAPGGGTQIQLRGVSSINASTDPLYVIDGIIVDNSQIANGLTAITQSARQNNPSSQDQRVNRAADLNPNDIESIQILKGPSASSIYGSRGTNGVVVITTKRGRAGKTTFDVAQRFGTAAISNKLDLRCLNTLGDYLDYTGSAGISDTTKRRKALQADTSFFNTYNSGTCHDFQQELYGENPFNYQTVASIRGATQQGTNFFISGLAQHDGGLVRNDFYNKQSLRANLGQQFGSRVNVRVNSELIHSLTQRGVSGNDNTGINPYTTMSLTPSFIELRRRPDGTFPKNPINSVGNNNPFQVAEVVKTPEQVWRLLGSGVGTLSILAQERQTLDLTLSGGVDAYNDNSRIISPASAYVEQVNALPGTIVNGQANVLSATLNGALNHRYTTRLFSATTSTGFRQDRRQNDVLAITGRGVFPGVTNVAASTQVSQVEGQDLVKALSLFAQEEFLTLSERLLLTAGVNSERTSNNGDPHKFYAYPKFSASYRLPWLPPVTDEMKLRVAYGRAGNQPTAGKYTFLTNLIQNGLSGYRASTIVGSPNIRPETASETEGGFDWTLLDGRARVSVTQFKKQVDNLLLQASIAPSTGFSSQWINGGQLSTHGTEIELGATPVQWGHFQWISNTTYASNKTRVTRLPVAPFIPVSGSFGSRFGNAFVQQGQLLTVLQAVNGCTALNSSGTCPAANRILKFMGNAAPDFQMGFSNDLSYGPFRLASLVDWRKGGLGANLTNNYFDGGMLADTAVGNARLREFSKGHAVYVEKTGFVKIREVTLGYDLPAGMTSTMFRGLVSSARLDLSGRNLYTWTRYSGLDPEVSNFGNQALGRFQDVTPYPPSRQFYVTINTTF